MDKEQLINAAQAAFKSKEVAAPALGVGSSAVAITNGGGVSFFAQIEPALTVVVLGLSAVWLLVQMWSRIAITRRTLSTPPALLGSDEGNEA